MTTTTTVRPAATVATLAELAALVAAAVEDPSEGWEDWEPPTDDAGQPMVADAVEEADRAEAEKMAEWMAGVQRRRAVIGAPIQEKIDELEARLEALRNRATEIDAPLRRRAEYLEGWLAAYVLRERDRTKGRPRPTKSVKLAYATLSTAERGGAWKVDPEAALPWLLAYAPDLVETEPKVRLADAKRSSGWIVDEASGAVVTPDGEPVPGFRVEPKVLTATVKLVDDGVAS